MSILRKGKTNITQLFLSFYSLYLDCWSEWDHQVLDLAYVSMCNWHLLLLLEPHTNAQSSILCIIEHVLILQLYKLRKGLVWTFVCASRPIKGHLKSVFFLLLPEHLWCFMISSLFEVFQHHTCNSMMTSKRHIWCNEPIIAWDDKIVLIDHVLKIITYLKDKFISRMRQITLLLISCVLTRLFSSLISYAMDTATRTW